MTDSFTNRLINESSPYLLQHAHNPVDWFPWGEEALQRAKSENKIMLVSIGYSACHWCHVMEKESFENEAVAGIMNENFVNIKIDREERPDLDHIYMDAVQAMTGSGGWPLNVFLTPDAKPFFGGTYFPPVKAYNRASWTEVLNGIKSAWESRAEEIKTQAETLTEQLRRSNDFGKINKTVTEIPSEEFFTIEQGGIIFQNIMKTADKEWGGFGNAPKFPQTFTIQYLLQYYHFTGNEEALQQAVISIDNILQGGIYDHVGGGFARYSTDKEWLAPHFEKMLYDNALLVNILSDAFQITKNINYEQAIRKTIGFVERELMNDDGGFYSALDADSEGEEGKYYVWQKKEIDELLGDDAELFCEFFDVSQNGNWFEGGHQKSHSEEGKNILRILKNAVLFAAEKELSTEEFTLKMDACLKMLLSERNKRVRPQLDDKVLLNWNALMVTALCKAAAALNDTKFRNLAEKSFAFLSKNFGINEEVLELKHTCKNNLAKYPAFLDDYAYLVQSCIYLQELTSDNTYLLSAKRLIAYVLEHFTDEESGYFFFTDKMQKDVIIRKKEVYDGAVPSGNSIMAENLYYLSVVFNQPDWFQNAQKMSHSLLTAIVRYPTSFAIWASVLLRQLYGVNEIVVTGTGFNSIRDQLMQQYIPGKILQCSAFPNKAFPLLDGKKYDSGALIYLCKNYSCKPAVKTPEELFLLLEMAS